MEGMPMVTDGMGLSVILIAVFAVIGLLVLLVLMASCRVYMKAGRKWWEALIPVYNVVVWCDMIQKTRHLVWIYLGFLVLMFMGEIAYNVASIGNLAFGVWLTYKLVRKFGKGVGFTAGATLLPFIYWPMLAWGKSKYDAKRN